MAKLIPIKLEDECILDALQSEAGRRGVSVPELIAAIVEDWYDDLFLEEDLQAIEQAKQESAAPVPWQEAKKRFQRRKKVAS